MAEDVRNRFVYRDDEALDKPFDLAQLRRLVGYVRPYRALVAAGVALTFIGVVARLTVPYILGLAIDHGLHDHNLQFLTQALLILLGCYVIQWGASSLRIWITNRLGQNVLHDLRQELFEHIQQLSHDFFDRRPVGSILVRITNDIDGLQELFTSGVVTALVDLVSLIGITVIILTIDVKLSLVSMVIIPVMMLATTKLRHKIQRGWQWVRTTRTRINIHLNEALQGMKVTQSFVQEPMNSEFFAMISADHRKSWWDSSFLADIFGPLIELTGGVGTCLVYCYGAILVGQGEITVGLLVSFANYLVSFWEPISRLGQVYSQLLIAMASSERIFELLDTPAVIDDAPDAYDLIPIEGRVELRQVSFSYVKDRPALQLVDLRVAAGEMVALIGHTGSGKTTITNLIARFYDATEGEVLIDGCDIRKIRVSSLRSQLGIVLQDTFIFSGTLMENIRFGRLDATDDEVVAAATAVRAHEFIERLPHGYETEVFERGSGISMGQRQLLSFARALLADPRILILDEATASIDTETELLIQEALSTLLKGRTSFVVAHRLSTIRQADRIVVLDHGEIVEMGCHEELLRCNGKYAALLRAQQQEKSVVRVQPNLGSVVRMVRVNER